MNDARSYNQIVQGMASMIFRKNEEPDCFFDFFFLYYLEYKYGNSRRFNECYEIQYFGLLNLL